MINVREHYACLFTPKTTRYRAPYPITSSNNKGDLVSKTRHSVWT
jgi:hypothetical protein